MQAQISKLESDLQRQSLEQQEFSKKNGASQDEIVQLRSQLRDAEQARDNLERDVNRLNDDVRMLRETVTKKDDDIRSSMTSVCELQRQAMEEKNSLWQELRLVGFYSKRLHNDSEFPLV